MSGDFWSASAAYTVDEFEREHRQERDDDAEVVAMLVMIGLAWLAGVLFGFLAGRRW